MDGEEESTSSTTPSSSPATTTTTTATLSQIKVKTLADRECIIDIDLNDTIEHLRELIHERMQIEPHEQRIIFQGRVLASSRTLASYGIENGYTVHLVDRPPPSLPAIDSTGTSDLPLSTTRTRRIINMGVPPRPGQRSGVAQLTPRLHNLTIDQPSSSTSRNARRSIVPETANGVVVWKLFVEERDGGFSRPDIESMVRNVINSTSYLSESDRNRFVLTWDNDNELRIRLPRMPSHVASPAFERLSNVESNVNYLRAFIDIVTEPNGLSWFMQRVLEESQSDEPSPDTTTPEDVIRYRLSLEEIALRLESIHNVVPSNRRVEQERYRNSSVAQQTARLEHINTIPDAEPYFLRHAIDADLTLVTRALREQQRRFFELEALLDSLIDLNAIKKMRDNFVFNDWRVLSLSLFFLHMNRIRHHIAHLLHTVTEIELPFIRNADSVQRLLPQYNTSSITVPRPHEGVLVIALRRPEEVQRVSERVSSVFTPPRTRTDVGNALPGEWPYLTFYPTGMLQEAHEMQIPLMSVEMNLTVQNDDVDDLLGTHSLEEVLQALHDGRPQRTGRRSQQERAQRAERRAEQREQRRSQRELREEFQRYAPQFPLNLIQQGLQNVPSAERLNTEYQQQHPALRQRVQQNLDNLTAANNESLQQLDQALRDLRGTPSTNTAPSRAVDTQPPPGAPTANRTATLTGPLALQFLQSALSRATAPPLILPSSSQTNPATDPLLDPNARGAENASLAPYPIQMQHNELRAIAKNISSRYRTESLLRLAANLTRIFQDQIPPWDIRLTSASESTLRDLLALALELITSGRRIDESREMMLAMIHDEELLVRAVSESMRALFVQGTFPTHLNRLILPLQEYLTQRTPEPVPTPEDAVEEEFLIRMPSDVSQPLSGSLRDLANARAERRRAIDERLRQQPTERRSPTPLVVGRSMRPEDEREAENILRTNSNSSNTNTVEDVDMDTTSSVNASPNPNTGSNIGAVTPASQVQRELAADRDVMNAALQELFQNPPEVGMAAVAAVVENQPGGQRRTIVLPQGQPRNSPRITTQQIRNNLMHSRLAAGPSNSAGGTPTGSAGTQDEIPFDFENATTTNIRRQTVSIDPFLSCTSRHSEFNRLHRMNNANPEASRMTNLSNDPNPDFTNFMTTMTIPQRTSETAAEDPEFSYSINRTETGEVCFENTEEGRSEFERVIRSGLRSFFGHLVETDAIIALNSVNVTGHPAPRNEVLQDLVTRHLNNDDDTARPFGAGFSGAALSGLITAQLGQNPPQELITVHMRPSTDSSSDVEMRSDQENQQQRPPLPDDISLEERLQNRIRFIHLGVRSLYRYMSSRSQGHRFPPGLWGMCLELLGTRLSEEDYVNLTIRDRMIQIIGESQVVLRVHLIENQMNGNARPSREDIQSISERLAASEDFFRGMLSVEPSPVPMTTTLNNRSYEGPWMLRQIEIDTIRQLIEAIIVKVEPNVFAEKVWDILRRYAERSVSVVMLLCDDNRNAENYSMFSIPRFLANFINGTAVDASAESLDDWFPVMEAWMLLGNDTTIAEVTRFMDSLTISSPSPSTSTSASTSASTSVRESVRDVQEGESMAKRRKCDESMEVDESDDRNDGGNDKNEKKKEGE